MILHSSGSQTVVRGPAVLPEVPPGGMPDHFANLDSPKKKI